MKYLDAKKKRSPAPEENKMQSGSLPTQQSISPDVLAKQLGVNINEVVGTGDENVVTNKDVREHAKKTRERNQKNPPISSPTDKSDKSK